MYEDFQGGLTEFTIYVYSKRLKPKMLTWHEVGVKEIIFNFEYYHMF